MLADDVLLWRGAVVLTRDLNTPADRSGFYSRVRRGEYVAVTRGAFVSAEKWQSSSQDERYLLLLDAASLMHPSALFSHLSSAALWRLPMIDRWPSKAQVIEALDGARHSNALFQRHRVPPPGETELLDGKRVTSLARTVVDVAATAPFGVAVAMADAALRRTTLPISGVPRTFLSKGDLEGALATRHANQGKTRAARVIDFADPLADRPGESVSRASMSIARIPRPLLQVQLRGASGRVYFADFFWPDVRRIGEFDGVAKYQDPVFLRGRSPERALLDEKAREDDLRAADYGFIRWGWATAVSPARLRAHLAAGGVR